MAYVVGVVLSLGVASLARLVGFDRDRAFYLILLIVIASCYVLFAGLAGHGIFDAFHPNILDSPGVPVWWPAFCLAFDVGVAAGFPRFHNVLTRGFAADERDRRTSRTGRLRP
jgi:hypothetical protein